MQQKTVDITKEEKNDVSKSMKSLQNIIVRNDVSSHFWIWKQ